jgi:hypothetical protein
MAELESRHTPAETQGTPALPGDPDDIGAFSAHPAHNPSNLNDDQPVSRISIPLIPRREIARLSGTFRLSSLPRHKPTIVFDATRSFRDDVDA